ncbi:MAG TPA: class I SAM-dependent methyltransferase [Nitrososphaeraceae archaeon]|nr:class I SAM-dependent methyltransferase [Nitrososphaeraceae archaeon]
MREMINDGKFLNLGTGPATQAICLAKRGFRVIGSDISQVQLQIICANEKNIKFIVDMTTNLTTYLMEVAFMFFHPWLIAEYITIS